MSGIPNVQFGQTPPTEPGALPPPGPAWPKVVGIFSIVIGSLGIAAHACGMIGTIFGQVAMNMMPDSSKVPPEQQATLTAISQHAPIMIAGSALSMIAAIVLLIAGIQCVRRRPGTRTTHLVWIVIRVVAAIVATIAAHLQFSTQMEAMRTMGASMPAGVGGFMMSFGIGMIIIGFLWAMAYPIFVAIWFLRAPVVAEINRWRNESPDLGGI